MLKGVPQEEPRLVAADVLLSRGVVDGEGVIFLGAKWRLELVTEVGNMRALCEVSVCPN